tara:strand:- start:984 stop:2057 length:1074 start_codon:yes stop_codon:yes gene_type:complete
MEIAKKLGLEQEKFCKMCLKTKMLLSNIIGHAAELQYEKFMENSGILYEKAPVDKHYDYIVNNKKEQVKRYEVSSTNLKKVGVNLTQTHGDRSAQDAFYKEGSFDRLVICDLSLKQFIFRDFDDIPRNQKYSTHLPGKIKIEREFSSEDPFDIDFFNTMKNANKKFPPALESLREKYNLGYSELLSKVCNLSLEEVDSLFCEDNFRLITGAKGFAAEEHFNDFLEMHNISYEQDTNMYSKVDHWLDALRVQVKFPNLRACDNHNWAVKTHKSHGSGVGELYKDDVFDVLALFIGFEMDEKIDKYLPQSVSNKWLFIPMEELERHHEHREYLKRVPKINKNKYKINDIDYLKFKIRNN